MHDFSNALATAVLDARNRLGKTQSETSELIDASPRTILNIENREANPKMHILYPLIRKLNIDPTSIFYPEREHESPAKRGLHAEVDCLTEEEAGVILPVFRDLVLLVRRKSGVYFGPVDDNSGQ